MYIITPAYPNMNSTYNISESQLKRIEKGFMNAYKIIKLVQYDEVDWSDFLLEYPFFHDSYHFIEIKILSEDVKEFEKWKGLVIARIRYLLIILEQEIEEKFELNLWPSEKDVHYPNNPKFKYACYLYISIKSIGFNAGIINLTNSVNKWRSSLYEQWHDPQT